MQVGVRERPQRMEVVASRRAFVGRERRRPARHEPVDELGAQLTVGSQPRRQPFDPLALVIAGLGSGRELRPCRVHVPAKTAGPEQAPCHVAHRRTARPDVGLEKAIELSDLQFAHEIGGMRVGHTKPIVATRSREEDRQAVRCGPSIELGIRADPPHVGRRRQIRHHVERHPQRIPATRSSRASC